MSIPLTLTSLSSVATGILLWGSPLPLPERTALSFFCFGGGAAIAEATRQGKGSGTVRLSTGSATAIASSPLALPDSMPEAKRDRFADVKRLTKAVHAIIVGSTGSGKSTLAMALSRLFGGQVVVLDPHAKPTDWPGLTVTGRGRDYKAIAGLIAKLDREFYRRYELYGQGQEEYPELTAIVDEWPAIVASAECSKVAVDWLAKMLREARKIKMRLVILTQDPNVESLGLKGKGNLRDCFEFVRLGEFAVRHARSLRDPEILARVQAMKRPCMVGSEPFEIPEIPYAGRTD